MISFWREYSRTLISTSLLNTRRCQVRWLYKYWNMIVTIIIYIHNIIALSSVINALSDKYHPLQTLADLMTLKEHFGDLRGKTLSWVGDGNNVLHDLMIGSIKMGMNVRVSTPLDYRPDEAIYQEAVKLAEINNVSLTLTSDPQVACKDSNVIVTDTWISMGQEEEAKKRKIDFKGYQVNDQLMGIAHPDAVFLHCLPRKPEEVTDEVFYSSQSLVFPEAENRMWTVMAVSLELLGHRWHIK